MAKDRFYINKDNREILKTMQDNSLLGIDSSVEAKECFLIAVALGIDAQKDVEHRDGYFRVDYLKTSEKSLVASVLLGMANLDDDIDLYADFDKAIDVCEKHAENGFIELNELISSAGDDQELLDRRLIKKLDSWYEMYVVE